EACLIFDRQILCWGEEKQNKLHNASIFIAGAGGLGCLMSEIMVRSGVGNIYLCDTGSVAETDLNRQIFYTIDDIGKKKIDVAEKRLTSIHGLTKIKVIDKDIRDKNFTLPNGISGIGDCLDNFESRFSLWDKLEPGCFYIHAGVEDFFGQVISLIKGKSPALPKIFANYNKTERTIPVNGGNVSVVSSIASTEVINNIFREPKLLNRLLIIDLSDYTFSKVDIRD
ncbi:ThiF family adenylyltransferase, partial [Spirochaetota bacterium]